LGKTAQETGKKQRHTIQELVDQDKVVLDGFLIELPKVAPAQLDQAVEELEDEGGVRVALGDGHQVDVFVLDMAEGGAAEGQDGRADLGVADDLDAEHVGKSRAAVIAEGPEDQVLAFLVEDENSGQHCIVQRPAPGDAMHSSTKSRSRVQETRSRSRPDRGRSVWSRTSAAEFQIWQVGHSHAFGGEDSDSTRFSWSLHNTESDTQG
jgi:hypothetical protein